MKTPHLIISSALLFAATALAFAQPPGGPGNNARPPGNQNSGPQRGPGGNGGLFALLDTNHDGVISADEIAAAPAVLKALADSNGQITPADLRPPPGRGPGGPGGPGQRPDPLGPLSLFDTNHDGVISADEIANAANVLKALANGDGQITPADLPPPPNGGPGGPRGGRGNRGPGSGNGPGGPGGPGAGGAQTTN